MKNIKKHFAIFISLIVLLVGCKNASQNSKENSEENNKKIVYTTVYPVYDFTKKIAEDKVDVVFLEEGAGDAHGFEPSAKDMKNISNADLFIYSGAGLESYIEKVKTSLNKDIEFVEASNGVNLILSEEHDHDENEEHEHEHNHENENKNEEHEHEHNHESENKNEEYDHEHDEHHEHHHHHHGPNDPHVWLSPKNAKIMLQNIALSLAKLDPSNKTFYEENLKKNEKEIDKLDGEFKSGLKDLKTREIVVSHEAFGYLCKEYGLTQVGIEGVMAESEPDAKTIKEIINLVKQKNIKVIFTEEAMNPKIVETISKETGAEVKTLNPLESIGKDKMEKGEEYFSIMRENLKNLTEALN